MTGVLKEGAERACRICGCTEHNACVNTDGPCAWVGPDLCSACPDVPVRFVYSTQGDWWTAYFGRIMVARLFCRSDGRRQHSWSGCWWLPSQAGGPTLAPLEIERLTEPGARRHVATRLGVWLSDAGLRGVG